MDNLNVLLVYMYSISVLVFKMDFLSHESILHVGGGFTSTRGTFGNVSKSCDMLCVAFGRASDISFSGGSDGNVFIWKDSTLQKSVKAHEGPLFAMHSLDKVRLLIELKSFYKIIFKLFL